MAFKGNDKDRIAGAQIMIPPEHLFAVDTDLCALQIADRDPLQRLMQGCQRLGSDAVHHNAGSRIFCKNDLQDLTDLSAASAYKNMGRRGQIFQSLRRTAFYDLHVLQTERGTVFCQETERVRLVFNGKNSPFRAGESRLDTHGSRASSHIPDYCLRCQAEPAQRKSADL